MTLQELVDQLKGQNLLKKDMVVPASCILFREGNLIIRNTAGNDSLNTMLAETGIARMGDSGNEIILSPLDHCHGQVAAKLDIPKGYYDRMLNGEVGLLDTNVNHWLGKNEGSYFIRSFVDPSEEKGIARAFLSDRYNVIDNYDVLFAALEAVKNAGVNLTIDSCDITDRKMYIRFIAPDIEIQAPELLKNYKVPGGSPRNGNTGIISGFVVSNSEIGAGQFSVSPRATVLACSNGMTFRDDAFNKIHLGSKMEAYSSINWSEETKQKNYSLIVSQVKDAVTTFISADYLGQRVAKMVEQGSEKLKHPVDAVKNVSKFLQLSEEKESSLMDFFIQGGDTTAFGVSQALTFHAHSKSDADEQFDLELAATDFLGDVKKFDRPAVKKASALSSANIVLN